MLHQPPIYFKILNKNVFVASRTSATKTNSSDAEALEVQSMLVFCPDPIFSLIFTPTLKGGLKKIPISLLLPLGLGKQQRDSKYGLKKISIPLLLPLGLGKQQRNSMSEKLVIRIKNLCNN